MAGRTAMLHPESGWPDQRRRIRSRALIGGAFFALAAIPVVVFALIGVPHGIRDPLVRNFAAESDDAARRAPEQPSFTRAFALLTGTTRTSGNHAEILTYGDETFPRLGADLRAVRRSITVHLYYIAPSTAVDTMVAMLPERAWTFVDTCLLYDGLGARELPVRRRDTLRAADVRVAAFGPMRSYGLDRANHQSDVRGIVVDGHVACTGGLRLDDKWLGAGRRMSEWRETNVHFGGPAVLSQHAFFVATWSEPVGALLTSERLFLDSRVVAPSSAVVDAALVSSPLLGGSMTAERLLARSIAGARRRRFISNAYFVPEVDVVTLLSRTARRGVDVRILTTGPESDAASTRLAGRRHYAALPTAGVCISEYRPTTIYAKTQVGDDVRSSIATSKFDNRSLAYKNELAFVARDARMVRVLDSLFLDDLCVSDGQRLATIGRGIWVMRLREPAAGVIGRTL